MDLEGVFRSKGLDEAALDFWGERVSPSDLMAEEPENRRRQNFKRRQEALTWGDIGFTVEDMGGGG